MEERKISFTFRNSYQNIFEAVHSYSVTKGRLSRKFKAKRLFIIFLTEAVILLLCMLEGVIPSLKDPAEAVTVIITVIAVSFAVAFINRLMTNNLIKNTARMRYEGCVGRDLPVRAEFDEEKLFLLSGYSKLSVPYDEIDFVISDSINFVFMTGSDNVIRNIPKDNQNCDDLFFTDELLREKLGERFICKM